MILTKFEMPLQSRSTIDCLRNGQKMHGVVTKLFNSSQSENHIVYRIAVRNEMVEGYVYSDYPAVNTPENLKVCGQRDLTEWLNKFETGTLVRFDLITCPSKKVHVEGAKNSKRRILRSEEDRIVWLNRKASQNGFEIVDVTEQKQVNSFAHHTPDKGGNMYLSAYQYQGVLRVTDPTLFRKALTGGIGPGKAYGFGMILVR